MIKETQILWCSLVWGLNRWLDKIRRLKKHPSFIIQKQWLSNEKKAVSCWPAVFSKYSVLQKLLPFGQIETPSLRRRITSGIARIAAAKIRPAMFWSPDCSLTPRGHSEQNVVSIQTGLLVCVFRRLNGTTPGLWRLIMGTPVCEICYAKEAGGWCSEEPPFGSKSGESAVKRGLKSTRRKKRRPETSAHPSGQNFNKKYHGNKSSILKMNYLQVSSISSRSYGE